MSGDALNYAYFQVQEVAEDIFERSKTTLQTEFGYHLLKVAKALRDLEWVYSGDYGDGDEVKSINKVLGKSPDNFKWDDNKVIDFVNWYVELHNLDFRYTLENQDIIEAFKNGVTIEEIREKENKRIK